jgi:hypothetical protein
MAGISSPDVDGGAAAVRVARSGTVDFWHGRISAGNRQRTEMAPNHERKIRTEFNTGWTGFQQSLWRSQPETALRTISAKAGMNGVSRVT